MQGSKRSICRQRGVVLLAVCGLLAACSNAEDRKPEACDPASLKKEEGTPPGGCEGDCTQPRNCVVGAQSNSCLAGQICAGNISGHMGNCYTPCKSIDDCKEGEYCETDRQVLGDEEPSHCRKKPSPPIE